MELFGSRSVASSEREKLTASSDGWQQIGAVADNGDGGSPGS